MDMYYCTADEKTIYCCGCGIKLTKKRSPIYNFETGRKNYWITKECNNIKCSRYKCGLKDELALIGFLIVYFTLILVVSAYFT